MLLPVKSLHDIVAAVDLFHLTVDLAQIFLLRHEDISGNFHHESISPRKSAG